MELCAAKERYDTKFVVKCSPVVFINKIKQKFRDSAKLEKENRDEMFNLTLADAVQICGKFWDTKYYIFRCMIPKFKMSPSMISQCQIRTSR